MNKDIYTSDEAKVAFVLSFLTDKEALKWKETYLATIWDNHEGFKYPTFKDIHALLIALTAKEKRELLSLPNTSLTEEKDEDF